jgi:hypothetical protein
VIVVSEQLPAGLAANAASVLAVTLGQRVDGLVGADVKDADGVAHPGIIYMPLPVLKAQPTKLTELVQAAASDPDVFFVSFTGLAQSCRTYDEYVEKMAAANTAELDVVGIGLHGPKKQINRLAGSLPLMG